MSRALRWRSACSATPTSRRSAHCVADPARARILLALGDGRALAASVLADEAGVSASTASAHLGKLVRGGLLTVERHGRHRYFRLAGPEVGELLEALAGSRAASPVRSLREGTKANAVRFARTCYDHLAGVLGTELMAALLEQQAAGRGRRRVRPRSGRPRPALLPRLRPRLPADPARAWNGCGRSGSTSTRWPRRRQPCSAIASTGQSSATTSPARSAPRWLSGCSSWLDPSRRAQPRRPPDRCRPRWSAREVRSRYSRLTADPY